MGNAIQLFAEIVFSLTNEEQIKGINNFNERIQIIAKLLRTKRWNTSKGFYNQSTYGQAFRNQNTKPFVKSHNKSLEEASQHTIQKQINNLKKEILSLKRGKINLKLIT